MDPAVVLILYRVPVSCMQDGHYSKKYPKAKDQIGADSYPLYRRSSPDSGGQVKYH